MKRWTVSRPGRPDFVVAADRMTITDGGTLIFWVGHEGQYADSILLAFAEAWWSQVEVIT